MISSMDIVNYTGFTCKVNGILGTIIELLRKHNKSIKFDIPDLECVFEFQANPVIDDLIVHEDLNYNFPLSNNFFCLDKCRFKTSIFDRFIKLKNIDKYEIMRSEYITDNTLAVHLRGTDKNTEVVPPTDKHIIAKIHKFVTAHPEIDRIFLATDDYHYRSLVECEFKNLVVFNRKNIISTNSEPIHLGLRFPTDRLYDEVLSDCFILSKCKYMLYSLSNVSHLALTMGAKTFKEIKCFHQY